MFSANSSRPWRIGLLIGLISLAGCATVVSDPACPPLVEYSRADLDKAAVEVESLPAESVISRMLFDYAAVRAMLRACQ